MTDQRGASRRDVLKAAGLGAGAALVAPGTVAAQGTQPPPLWAASYRAKKGHVSLAMYRKRAGQPRSGESARPVLFLVHGSSISAKPSFDLTVPGKGEYSLMSVFARWGYDVWTMDHEGYGQSDRTDGNSDIRSGVEDLQAAVEVVARETGQARYHF